MPESSSYNALAIAICLTLALAGCSEGKVKPTPSTTATPTPTPVPMYTEKHVNDSLFNTKDLGEKWTKSNISISTFEAGELRGCSNSKIKLPGNPTTSSAKFGAPKYKTRGANYIRFTAVYPDAKQASEAMNSTLKELTKCPASKKIPQKKITDDSFIYQHDDTWDLNQEEVDGWLHLRGSEKSVYSPGISNINVFYFFIDYAQRGNLIFSSIYWQRVRPKDSGKPIADKATELLMEQLKRFG